MTTETVIETSSRGRMIDSFGFLFERIVRRLLGRVTYGTLELRLPDGRTMMARGTESGPHACLNLCDWSALTRVVSGGQIGFAEGYLAEAWTSPDLVQLLSFMARNEAAFGRLVIENPFRGWLQRRAHARNANTKRGSRRNIEAHYDLGNDFYQLWLDSSLNYSAAIHPPSRDRSLEAAQAAKMAEIARLLELERGMAVLEIGCGWGALAAHLAEQKACSIKGITLSSEQLAYANARFEAAGLQDRASAHLVDYRDTVGLHDRIVSIEMIEAVGEQWWPVYFQRIHDLLKPGGHAVIQAITIAPTLFDTYRRRPDFIQHYVFPGGMLPTPGIIEQQARKAGLVPRIERSFGDGYAGTLAEWRRRFHDAWPQIAALGYPARFRHLWDYYLAYCEAGFRIGSTDVHLVTLRKPA
jgi:cyclopropane-fatty-acyl-phospholipid synthase